jgi:hypothetical protein
VGLIIESSPNGGITVDQEVRWLLAEKLLHARTGLMSSHDDLIGRRSRLLTAFDSTLEALKYVHSMSEEESVQWRNKMWRANGLEPSDDGEPATNRLVYLGEGEAPQPDRIKLVPQYPRKITGPHETLAAFAGRLQVEEIEYDDSITLIRWQIGPMPDVDAAFPELSAALEEDISGMDEWAIEHFRTMNRKALRRFRIPRFELEDNVGTEYIEHPVGGGGGAEIKGSTAFTPGTPSQADHLFLHWLGSTLEIDL